MLNLEQVDVFYGKLQALYGLSLEVEGGHIVAIIGANGAGKSTLLKTISGLLHPAKGSITFEGQRIHGLAPADIVALGIGQCPEERHLWPDMTVWENLIMGAYARKDRLAIQEDVHAVCELFPMLEERRSQKAGSLSGGEQQMVAIARTMMARPRLIMFDEPSLGLAPKLVEQTADTIREINKRGTTVLLVEQNAAMALKMADKAYVLETGRVVFEGPGHQLLEDVHVKKAYLGM